MKKLIALILSTLIIVTFFVVSANAVTYHYDYYLTNPVSLDFFINPQITDAKEFKTLSLKINWDLGLDRNSSSEENKVNSALDSVTSRISEAKIIIKYDENEVEYGRKGTVTFSLNSENGVDLSGSPFLTMNIKPGRDHFAKTQNVEYYVQGEFLGIDGVDYAKSGIITTSLSNTTETRSLEQKELHVENISNPESVPTEYDRTETTESLSDTIQPTTSATEQEPTEPKETVKKTTTKKKNPIKVTVKTKTVKAKKLKKGKVSVKAIIVKKAKGEVKYSKVSGSKRLTINKTTGKIKIKKGTKKGNYTIKVKVTAKGNNKYKSKTIIKKVKIKVK